MKYLKIFLFLVAGVVMTACSDSDDWNTAKQVTVEMGQAEYATTEGRGVQKVPVKLVGNPNGPVKVTVKVTVADPSYGYENAIEDVHYYVTSKSIVIGKEDKEAWVEFMPLNDTEINDDRYFVIKLVSAEGALINEAAAQTVVTIRDNDNSVYDRIGGDWVVSFESLDDGSVYTMTTTLTPYTEDDGDFFYKRVVKSEGGWASLIGNGFPENEMNMPYNETANTLSIPAGFVVAESLNFGGQIGLADIITAIVDGGSLSAVGSISGQINDDLNEITFGDQELYYVVPVSGQLLTFDGFYNIVMKRVEE